MTRQVTDNLYIELDYFTPEEYYTYEAAAAAALSSSATMSVTGDKIVEAQAAMSATFTQSASITHIEGVDLFAFTDAALSAQVDRLRDGNIAVSAVFNAAIDVSRIVQVNADESAEFTFTTTVVRSRDSASSLEAAFSLAATSTRIIQSSAALTAEATLSATISHIEGADLTAFANASLSAASTITATANASLTSQTTLSGSLSGTINAAAAFSATAQLSASGRVLEPRTTFTTDFGDGFTTLSITNSSPKFGAGALNIPPVTNINGQYTDYSGAFQFIVVGTQVYYFANAYTYISSDLTGTSWTRYDNNLTALGRNVIRVGSNFITYSGGNGGNTFYSSSDGLTWTSTTATSSLTGTTVGLPIVHFVSSNYYVLARATTGIRVFRGTALNNLNVIYEDLSSGREVQVSDFVLSGTQLSYYGYQTASGSTSQYARFSNNGTTWTGFGTNVPSNYFATEYNVVDGVYYVYRRNSAGTAHVISYASSTSGPWTNLTVPSSVETIRGGNGKLFVRYNDGSLYSGSSITSLNQITNYALGAAASTNTFWTGSRFINFADNKVYNSTDGTTFSSNLLPVPANSLPGKITYTSLTNDFNSVATIDFWIKTSSSNFGTFLKIQGDNQKYFNIFQANGSFQINGQFNDNSSVNLFPGTDDLNAGWNHVRITFSGGVSRLWINGATQATDSSWGGTFGLTNAKVILSSVYESSASDLNVDELLITDELLTSPSTSSFSVPTQRWNNSDSTDLLLHFNTDFYDDSELFVNPSAALTATATLTASLTAVKQLASSMSSEFAVSARIGRLNEIELLAFTNASLTATISKFINFESSQSAAFDISAVNTRTRDFASAQSSEFTQTASIEKFVPGSANIASEFTQSTQAVKTTDVVFNTSSEFTQSTAIVKTAEATLSISSAFTPVIVAVAAKNGEIILQSAATLTADTTRTRDITADVNSTATLSVDISKLVSAGATLSSEFAIDATTQGTIDVAAVMASEFTQTTVVQRNRFGAAEFSSVFQQNTNTQDSLARQGSASLSVSTALSAVNTRVRFASITTDAIFSELVVTAVTASADIVLTATSTMDITAERTRGIQADVNCQTALSVPGERIQASAQASLAVLTTLSAEGTTATTGAADLTVNTTLTAFATRSRDIDILADNFATLTALAERTRGFESAVSATAAMTVDITKLVSTSAQLVSTVALTAVGTRQRNATANLVANGGVLVVGKVIKIDTYVYIIPSETRIHTISSETRKYAIRSETRKHTIRRA
jgi:hypothetical protein